MNNALENKSITFLNAFLACINLSSYSIFIYLVFKSSKLFLTFLIVFLYSFIVSWYSFFFIQHRLLSFLSKNFLFQHLTLRL